MSSVSYLLQLIIYPLKQVAETKDAILSKQELQDIFSYWEVILRCHQTLLKSLEARMAEWSTRPEIGDIFLEKVGEKSLQYSRVKTAFIKLYKHYINNFDKSIVTYRQLQEKNHKWKEFLEKLEYTPKLNKLGLQSFLIMPVQRYGSIVVRELRLAEFRDM